MSLENLFADEPAVSDNPGSTAEAGYKKLMSKKDSSSFYSFLLVLGTP
jgi:hypothetical protein